MRRSTLTTALVAAPVCLAGALLAIAGVFKLRDPRPGTRAITAAGVTVAPGVVRLVGLTEIGVGAGSLVTSAPALRIVLAAVYLAFAMFLARLIALKADVGCGCAGSHQQRPSRLHVAFNVVAALAVLAAVRASTPAPVTLVTGLGLSALPYLAGITAAGYLAYAATILWPQTRRFAAARRTPARH